MHKFPVHTVHDGIVSARARPPGLPIELLRLLKESQPLCSRWPLSRGAARAGEAQRGAVHFQGAWLGESNVSRQHADRYRPGAPGRTRT